MTWRSHWASTLLGMDCVRARSCCGGSERLIPSLAARMGGAVEGLHDDSADPRDRLARPRVEPLVSFFAKFDVTVAACSLPKSRRDSAIHPPPHRAQLAHPKNIMCYQKPRTSRSLKRSRSE